MAIVTLLASSLPVETTATVPSGYTQIANTLRVNTGTPQYFTGNSANNCIWVYNTQLTGSIFYSRGILDTVGSDTSGSVVCSLAGVGYEFIINSTLGARLFSMTTGGVLAVQKGSTVAVSASAGQILEIEFRTNDPSPGNVRLICKVNGVTLINFTEANANTSWYGGFVCRSAGRLRGAQVEYTPPFSISTSTSPLVPNASSSWTTVGFSAGAAALSFGGVSVPVTIASNAFTAIIPMIADNVVWPKLPATAQTITLTQGANSATVSSNISLPTGYDTVRDGSNNPANFSGIITDDATYLGKPFLDAGNPLTTNDTWVFATQIIEGTRDYVVNQDSGVDVLTSTLPRTDTGYCYRGLSGKYFEHSITLEADGTIILDGRYITQLAVPMVQISVIPIKMIGIN